MRLMKALSYIALAVFLCLLAVSCGSSSHEPDEDGDNSRVVYSNSFESADDTTGWMGISEQMFVSDPAPNGGDRSLHIDGGCIQPTAYIVLPLQPHDASYSVSCWGRVDDQAQRGTLILAIDAGGEQNGETVLVVDGDEWTFLRSEQSIYCPSDKRLRLNIMIGGIRGASMLIDCIKVERVN